MPRLLNLTLPKTNPTKIKLRLEKFIKEESWQHVLVFSFIAFVAWIFNKPFEALVFCLGHYFIRKSFSKQFHFDSIYLCIFLTLTLVFIGICCTLPVKISLLSSIPLTFLISWFGYAIQDWIDLSKDKTFDLQSCSEQELVARCREIGLSGYSTRFAIDLFIHKLKQSDLADKYSIDEKSVQQRKWRLKDKLVSLT